MNQPINNESDPMLKICLSVSSAALFSSLHLSLITISRSTASYCTLNCQVEFTIVYWMTHFHALLTPITIQLYEIVLYAACIWCPCNHLRSNFQNLMARSLATANRGKYRCQLRSVAAISGSVTSVGPVDCITDTTGPGEPSTAT